jgi:hypothetical protein
LGQLPPATQPWIAPKLDITTFYPAPDAGATSSTLAATFGPKAKSATVDISTQGANGLPIDKLAVVAVTDVQAEKAGLLCRILGVGDPDGDDYYNIQMPSYAQCVKAVTFVLQRYDQILAQRAQGLKPLAHAARRSGCRAAKFFPVRRRPRAAGSVGCAGTQAGTRFAFHARRGKSLRTAMRHVKIVVGRSLYADAQPGDRVGVLWHASTRP